MGASARSTTRSGSEPISPDRPIRGSAEDGLGRSAFAEQIARQIELLPPGESFVLGLEGPWGSGKTSVLNMLAEALEQRGSAYVLQFNPWMFSTAEELLPRYFAELSEAVRRLGDLKPKSVSKTLAAYAQLVAPLSPTTETPNERPSLLPTARTLRNLAGDGDGGIEAKRRAVDTLLGQLPRPLVVLIDDIDRLEHDQIRGLVKLVRLLADFPNVTYVLSYDRERVAEALGGTLAQGQEFLEKIVQLVFRLPIPSTERLQSLLLHGLDRALGLVEQDLELDHQRWAACFHLIIRPLVRTPRDVRRYVASVPLSAELLGVEVDLVDLLVLRAIEIFDPQLHETLAAHAEAISASHEHAEEEVDDAAERALDQLMLSSGPRSELTRELLTRLFPRAGRARERAGLGSSELSTWRRDRRVAHREVLDIYLSHVLPEETLSSALVRQAIATLDDADGLRELVSPLSATSVESLITRLEDYETELPLGAAYAASLVLLEQLPRLRSEPEHPYAPSAELKLRSLLLRLLRRPESRAELPSIVSQLLEARSSLSGKRLLLDVLEQADERLLTKRQARPLEQMLEAQILAAPVGRLREERDLFGLLGYAKTRGHAAYAPLAERVLADDGALAATLASALTTSRNVRPGEAGADPGLDLAWAELCGLFDEEVLRRRILQIGEPGGPLSERASFALGLATQYASPR